MSDFLNPELSSYDSQEWDAYFQKNCGDVNDFQLISKIGQGGFAEVFKGVHKKSRTSVAMKRIIDETSVEGIPISALNEIRILRKCDFPNIVTFLGTCRGVVAGSSKSSFFLNFELCDTDLRTLLNNATKTNWKISIDFVKHTLYGILLGVDYLHNCQIIHRDIKPGNILFKDGIVKLADLGLAVEYRRGNRQRLSCNVGTRTYNAPELLLGENLYGPAVDMWSVGVTFVEVIMQCCLFCATNVPDQLLAISKLCGSITPEVWRGVELLPGFKMLNQCFNYSRKVKELVWCFSQDTALCDLLDRLLTLDPSKRPNSSQALHHQYFAPFGSTMTSRVSSTLKEQRNPRFSTIGTVKAPQRNSILLKTIHGRRARRSTNEITKTRVES